MPIRAAFFSGARSFCLHRKLLFQLISASGRLVMLGRLSLLCTFLRSFEISTESFPNVEHSKMWSELDECALGVDSRVIGSTLRGVQQADLLTMMSIWSDFPGRQLRESRKS